MDGKIIVCSVENQLNLMYEDIYNLIKGISKMLGPTSTVSYPHQKREKIYINVFPQQLTTWPNNVLISSFRILSVRHLKILVYSAQIKHEETNIFLKPVEPFETSQDL
jgi:hypothetical protein